MQNDAAFMHMQESESQSVSSLYQDAVVVVVISSLKSFYLLSHDGNGYALCFSCCSFVAVQ